MWLDGFQWEKAKVRLTEWRVQEAMQARVAPDAFDTVLERDEKKKSRKKKKAAEGPDRRILAIACPYEITRFEDAVKTVEGADQLIVKDIVELLAESIGV